MISALLTWYELRCQHHGGKGPGGSSWPGYGHGHLICQQQRLLIALEESGVLRMYPRRIQSKCVIQVNLSKMNLKK